MQSDNKGLNSQLPPPPPPISNLGLGTPTVKDDQYLMYLRKKHKAMLNGQAQYVSMQQQVDTKLKDKYQKSQENSHQNESTGQKQLRNLQICTKCHKCGYWVENTQMKMHQSFHVAPIQAKLLLGDRHSSQSQKELFQRNNVTHVVNAALQLKNRFQDKAIYLKLELMDKIGQRVIEEAEKGADFVDKALKEGGIVFVHCALGQSRSVSVLLIYFMKYRKMGYGESLELIRKTRPLAKPNPSYIEQLKEYEQLLKG